MRILAHLCLGAVLSWYGHGSTSLAAAQQASANNATGTATSASESSTGMVDPSERNYPTTVTSTWSTTRTGSASGSAVTVDYFTTIDPWPVSPDPEAMPTTIFETQITHRVVSSAGAAPATTALATATVTWTLWTVQAFDMPPYTLPDCPGPGGCAFGSVKPNGNCEALGSQTRCAHQCLLRDWMWWCAPNVDLGPDGPGPIGRVCDGGNSTSRVNGTTYKRLLVEPCDHTDFKPGCPLCPDDSSTVQF